MGLVGTICCQTGQPRLFSECEDECRQGVCKHSLPLLVNMRKNSERREGIGVSSSVLGGCPRQYILGRTTDYYEDPEDYYARWFGSFGHYAIEMDGPYPGVIQETRFYRSIAMSPDHTVEISGQPDWIDLNTNTIADHKMTGSKPREPRQEHIQQLNVYRWLVEGGTGYSKEPGKFHLPSHVVVEMPKIERLRLFYYHPGRNGRHTEYDVPIWSDDAVESYIRWALEPIERWTNGDALETIGLYGSNHAWRANFCPFRHDCNPGQCCMAPVSEIQPR